MYLFDYIANLDYVHKETIHTWPYYLFTVAIMCQSASYRVSLQQSSGVIRSWLCIFIYGINSLW